MALNDMGHASRKERVSTGLELMSNILQNASAPVVQWDKLTSIVIIIVSGTILCCHARGL